MGFDQENLLAMRFRAGVLSCHPRARPCATVRTVSAWLSAHRRAHDSRPHQRAATRWVQAVMVLRWMIDATSMRTLARDARVSPATAYWYLHEALQLISSQAPQLPDVLRGLKDQGEPFVCLDGTLIRFDRVTARTKRGNHSWYSGKHKAFGGNVQVLTDFRRVPGVGLAGRAGIDP